MRTSQPGVSAVERVDTRLKQVSQSSSSARKGQVCRGHSVGARALRLMQTGNAGEYSVACPSATPQPEQGPASANSARQLRCDVCGRTLSATARTSLRPPILVLGMNPWGHRARVALRLSCVRGGVGTGVVIGIDVRGTSRGSGRHRVLKAHRARATNQKRSHPATACMSSFRIATT